MPALLKSAKYLQHAALIAGISFPSPAFALSESECRCLENLLKDADSVPENLLRESERLFEELCADAVEFEIYESISASMIAEAACEYSPTAAAESEPDSALERRVNAIFTLVVSAQMSLQQRQIAGQIEWRNDAWLDASIRMEFRARKRRDYAFEARR